MMSERIQKFIPTLIILGSIVVTVVMWGRLAWAATEPPSTQYMDIELDGEMARNFLFCFDTALVDPANEVIYRNCAYDFSASDDRFEQINTMVRYDMADGKAEIVWQFPDADYLSDVMGVAQNDAGEFLLLKEAEDYSVDLYYLTLDGAATRLFSLPDEQIPYGLTWQGERIELVYGEQDTTVFTVATLGLTGQAEQREIQDFACDETTVCRLEMAYFEGGAWHMVYSRVPAQPEGEVTAEILEGAEGQAPVVTGNIPLQREYQYVLDENGRFDWQTMDTILENSRSNITNHFYSAIPVVWNGEAWGEMEIPTALQNVENVDFSSHYTLGDETLTWIPTLETSFAEPKYFRINGDWVTFDDQYLEKYFYFAADGAGEPLNVDESLSPSFSYDVIMAAPDGGFWYLASEYGYVKLDENLARADAPDFGERLKQVFGEPHYRSDLAYFFREDDTMKKLTLPLLLFFMPVVAVLAWISRRLGYGVQWVVWASIVYLGMVLLMRGWFWDITDIL